MSLREQLTTETIFSRILSIVLFILLPFLGFYLGIRLEKYITPPCRSPIIIFPGGNQEKTIEKPINKLIKNLY